MTLRLRDTPIMLAALLCASVAAQPVSYRLVATRFGCHEHPQLKREVCGGDFVGQLTRSEFGMTLGLPFVADRVRLVLQVEGLRE
jgi:polyisoprenoid-binding protein YceI